LEARDTAIAEHQVNVAACKEGQQSCDYSKLTQAETSTLATAEHQRNYASCLKGYGYCDRSRLTPAEAAAIPAKNSPTPR
jgi:hypothetical protein